MRFIYYPIITLLLLIVWPQIGQAQKPDRNSLKGLQDFFVLVEHLPQSAIDIGITTEQLKTDVELRSRKALILVKDKADACLYINISVIANTDKRTCIYSIHMELLQGAYLERDKSIFVVGATWERGGLGGTSVDLAKTEIRELLGDYVDEFINDYLAANPRK